MNVVESRQVEILLVPTKECFPGTNVAIWLSDALDLFSQRIPEE